MPDAAEATASDARASWARHWLSPLRYWDLLLVGMVAVAVLGLVTEYIVLSPIVRMVVGVVYTVLFVGYAFVAALFPTDAPFDGIDRLGLSVGTGVALTALITIGMNFTSWGIRPVPVATALALFTGGCLLAAALRRSSVVRMATSTPFVAPFDVYLSRVRLRGRGFLRRAGRSRLELVLSVGLVLMLFLSAGSVAFALATPRPGEQYTEFALYTEDNGTLVAGDYPTSFEVGETKPVIVTVHNHEFEQVEYTVLVRARDPETGRSEQIERFDAELAHNETRRREVAVGPPFAGQRVRIEFLLYRGSATDSNPYHRLHLLANVSSQD